MISISLALAALLMANGKENKYDARKEDARVGAVVYQVFPDRFAPSEDIEKKRSLYAAPKILEPWGSRILRGVPDTGTGMYTHELVFTGGDLDSITDNLNYIRDEVGADVLFLNPIWKGLSNHKYDTIDYYHVSPEFGDLHDLKRLVDSVHSRKMRIVLDAVFDHVGRANPIFISAENNKTAKYRDWFYWDKDGNARRWFGVPNLPILNLKNKQVIQYIKAVMKYNLQDCNVDGLRLDAAFEIGPEALRVLAKAAHHDKPGCLIVGELLGYPSSKQWDMLDGSYNFTYLKLCEEMINGNITGGRAGSILNQLAGDTGTEYLLRSWTHVDNHDTVRIASRIKDFRQQKLAIAMQHLLPGCPVIYYGSELGMESDEKDPDPSNRACMRWDLVSKENEDLKWIKKLIALRRSHPAIRYGDMKVLNTTSTLAFARVTDKVRETAIVIINPTNKLQHESIPTRMGNLIGYDYMQDSLSTNTKVLNESGFLSVDIPPYGIYVLTPIVSKTNGFSPYDRIP